MRHRGKRHLRVEGDHRKLREVGRRSASGWTACACPLLSVVTDSDRAPAATTDDRITPTAPPARRSRETGVRPGCSRALVRHVSAPHRLATDLPLRIDRPFTRRASPQIQRGVGPSYPHSRSPNGRSSPSRVGGNEGVNHGAHDGDQTGKYHLVKLPAGRGCGARQPSRSILAPPAVTMVAGRPAPTARRQS